MPLTVPCPECGTKLVAPDSAVGQRLRCPKCGTLATVPDLLPAEEVAVVEAKVVPPPKPKPIQAEAADEDEDERPRKKRRRDEEDAEDEERPRKKKRPRYADDDDDYEHDRPRKKKRRAASGGSKGGSGALIAGVVIVGMLLLAATGFAVYLFAGKGNGSLWVKKTPAPPGWSQFTYPQDGFKVYLPKAANRESIPTELLRRDFDRGRGRFGMGRWEMDDDVPEVERAALVTSGDLRNDVHVELWVIKFRDRLPASIRDRMRNYPTGGNIGGVETRTVRWLGHDALEIVHLNGVMRVVYLERHVVLASIGGPNGGRARPEEEAGFFDNIELTN
jgi:hypothetical protein